MVICKGNGLASFCCFDAFCDNDVLELPKFMETGNFPAAAAVEEAGLIGSAENERLKHLRACGNHSPGDRSVNRIAELKAAAHDAHGAEKTLKVFISTVNTLEQRMQLLRREAAIDGQ
jgi:hypothetical protein